MFQMSEKEEENLLQLIESDVSCSVLVDVPNCDLSWQNELLGIFWIIWVIYSISFWVQLIIF